MKRAITRTYAVAIAIALGAVATAAAQTTRVSVASDGTQANRASYSVSLSADGRVVVFSSDATNLDANGPTDGGGYTDIFLHVRESEQVAARTSRISLGWDRGRDMATEAVGNSFDPVISADGRWVAFASNAPNLLRTGPDRNNAADVFLYGVLTGDIVRLSRARDGGDANGRSDSPSISADGRYVAFRSSATNLVPNGTNGRAHIFVVDTTNGQIDLVSVASGGQQANRDSSGPSISADGQRIAFYSHATNLVSNPTTGNWPEVFMHDRQNNFRTTLVSVASDGTNSADYAGAYDPAISANGRFIIFTSDATNLVPGASTRRERVFIRDMDQPRPETAVVSVANDGTEADGNSFSGQISGDGRFVVFTSSGTNLAPGLTSGIIRVFVRDRQNRATLHASVSTAGAPADGHSGAPFDDYLAISRDGRVVAFESIATNLVPLDTNGVDDIFVRVLPPEACDERADCAALPGPPSNLTAQVSGTTVAFNWMAPVTGGPVETYVFSAGSSPASIHVQLATGNTATSFAVNAPPGTYYVRVAGRNSGGTGAPSNEVIVNVDSGGCTAPPGVPIGLRATVTGRDVALDWAAGAGCPAQSHAIEIGFVFGATNFVIEAGNVVSVLATGAPPGTYYVRVRARNAFGASGPSNEVIVMVQ